MEQNPLSYQVGGSHYQSLNPQPIELFIQNNIPFPEACAIKYLSRWRNKNGLEDLKKALQFLQFAINRDRQKKAVVDRFKKQLPLREAALVEVIANGYVVFAASALENFIKEVENGEIQ